MIKRITEAFHLSHFVTPNVWLQAETHWFRHIFCRLHVAYILFYKHYYCLKYLRLRVGPIDTRPIYFRFNKTESILVIYLIREPLVGNETDSSVESGDLVLCLRVTSQLFGGPRSYIAAYVYTHITKVATYSVCMYFIYISAYHIHISQTSVAFISASYLT